MYQSDIIRFFSVTLIVSNYNHTNFTVKKTAALFLLNPLRLHHRKIPGIDLKSGKIGDCRTPIIPRGKTWYNRRGRYSSYFRRPHQVFWDIT